VTSPSPESLDAFLARIPWDDMVDPILPHFDQSRPRSEAFLKTLQAEARLGYRLIFPFLANRSRILEIGSGMGLLASFLHHQGHPVTALEPGLGGFGVSTTLAQALSSHPAIISLPRLDLPAESLSPSTHGQFDLIYSINVLEHIPALESALQGMTLVLASDGMMLHTCPNYTIPYEPHFGIPLIPFVPRLTAIILPRLQKSDLWNSLNFITATRIRRAARSLGLRARFHPDTLYRTFQRLEADPEFLRRQSNPLVIGVFRTLKTTRALSLLRFLPPSLATPMVFELHPHSPS
jgi:SAM-dependent methyltransferase